MKSLFISLLITFSFVSIAQEDNQGPFCFEKTYSFKNGNLIKKETLSFCFLEAVHLSRHPIKNVNFFVTNYINLEPKRIAPNRFKYYYAQKCKETYYRSVTCNYLSPWNRNQLVINFNSAYACENQSRSECITFSLNGKHYR